ncbi:MAG: hypothetical protein QOC99_64 [Acidobacteriota bacterium]|jgi:hypothetical protein|nr:hypothetical protein [Acidobacteriota bacterium]MDT7777552.1 hypothetical protein [Acidobacteriota bacterium]
MPGKGFRWHGYVGLFIILAAEVLLFAGNTFVGGWFTPIAWVGFLFLVDALIYRAEGRSLFTTDRLELLIIAVVSIACWWLFEFYNEPRFWTSDFELWWHYHDLIQNPYMRRVGYDLAFATIFPAMFLTAELFSVTVFRRWRELRPVKLSMPLTYVLVASGALMAVAPLLFVSKWLVPLVWLSYVLLLDPLNALRGWPSVTGDLARGDWRRLLALLASGGLCGVLWEFWNYWALTKWTYTVPYLGDVKLFEMPVLGFLGFPPFAVECWAMYVFCRSLLTSAHGDDEKDWPGFWPGARSKNVSGPKLDSE